MVLNSTYFVVLLVDGLLAMIVGLCLLLYCSTVWLYV